MKRYIVLSALALMVAALACEWTTSQEGFRMLHEAETGEEEAEAFERIWSSGGQIGLMSYDEAGNPLDMSLTDWWVDLHHIRLAVGATSTEHEMIDPENIFILMGE